jgi:hypothetical protein
MPGRTLSRRTLLRGLGTTIALPFLDAMASAKVISPCRMAFVYVPNGVIMEQWTPVTEGVSAPLPDSLPAILEPLAPFRSKISVVSGLAQDGGRAHGDGGGDHARAAGSYLTGVHPKKTYGADLRAGVSVDQIAAQKLSKETQFASLELGCEEGILSGNCDNGYSCAYNNSLSWRTPSSPLPPEVSPRAVFERLFGSGDTETDPARRAMQKAVDRSILDFVLEDARQIQRSLGPTDRRKLDEYMFTIRDIEVRIASAERKKQVVPHINKPELGNPDDLSEYSKLMYDMLTIAFQANLTRVATLIVSLEQSNRSYREIGIPESHHGLSHHQGSEEKIEKLARINKFHSEGFAYFLRKLDSLPDGDGTLLDNSIIMYGSGLSDGNRHEHHNLPTLIAGGACGGFRPGRHIRYDKETPMSNLFLTMLDKMGIRTEQFANSTGQLTSLSELG